LQDRTFERVGGRQQLVADVRIVAATHRDLEQAIVENRFRQDLYYRLRVVEIDLPPLRERGAAEIESLARHFADGYAARYGRPAPAIASDAMAAIVAHDFPGNVRELEHWIESAIALAADGKITAAHLPARRGPGAATAAAPANGGAGAVPLGLELDEAMRRYVKATVAACGGNKTEAARRLGVGRNTITRALGRR
jgi:Nif-specific regulatory protein